MTAPETNTAPSRSNRRGLIVLLVLAGAAAALLWSNYHIPAAERCRGIATDETLSRMSQEVADENPGHAARKPPSDRDRRWYAKNCYNGMPLR